MLYFPEGASGKSSKSITILLPYYMDEIFIKIFNTMGYSVIHSYRLKVLAVEARRFHIDLALEWQHGPEDYPIRGLLRRCKKSVPVLLCLNWNSQIPSNFSSLGYQDYLMVPFKIDELIIKFYDLLPDSKKLILRDLWEKEGKKQG